MHPNITKIIDQYLNNELSESDRIAFEQRLESHPELNAEVELQRTILEGVIRASQRTDIKFVANKYHYRKLLKLSGFSVLTLVIATTALLLISKSQNETNIDNKQEGNDTIDSKLKEKLNNDSQFENLLVQYFSIPEEGEVILSEKGVLLSIPENAFLLDGKPFKGKTIVQYQEAIDASDIVKSGLSTMSGNKLLETQGMFGVRGYTENGTPLEFNPEVGVYIQVPVDEYKENMQLFDGKKLADGTIDWQNPEPLEKILVPVDMTELNFYPIGYEAKLDELKWKKDKVSRDSLYLSFEMDGKEIIESDTVGINKDFETNINKVSDIVGYYIDVDSSAAWNSNIPVEASYYIPPSQVLGFWNKKFNNTNLSTREFEKRMAKIHGTCNVAVLDKYLKNLNKPLSEIDRQVVEMGFPEFKALAEENVGALNPNNPHLKGLMDFYKKSIDYLKATSLQNQEKEKTRQKDWDKMVNQARNKEVVRTRDREQKSLKEEYNFNLKNVRKQLGYSKGFTIRHGNGTIKNIDAYVFEATRDRKTTQIKDPFSDKTAKITYNDFNFVVPNADKYIKLYAYLFPHQLNSYQRLNGTNGKFSFPLNNDIIYDIGIVGITTDGYEYFQKQSFKSGNLGSLIMKMVSESQMDASIEQLNNKRISRPMHIKDEMEWLKLEKADYIAQKIRMEMSKFRKTIRSVVYPCIYTEETTNLPESNTF